MPEVDERLAEALGAVLAHEDAPEARALVTAAVADDPALADELAALAAVAEGVRGTAPLPEGLEARVAAAVREVAPAPVVALRPRRRWPAAAAAAAAALALGVGLGATLDRERPAGTAQPGSVELADVRLANEAGRAVASARVTVVGEGRYVRLRSRALPPVDNDTQLYQLWFVSADGERRVSAGTFHPDSSGEIDVLLFAAADPAKLPVLAVTREDRSGPASPTLPDLLRSDR